MKPIPMIQVFLKNDNGQAEVHGELVKYTIVPSGVWITHKEGTNITTHFFPNDNLHMLRLWEDNNENL